jgi:hypothetical protein
MDEDYFFGFGNIHEIINPAQRNKTTFEITIDGN